MAVRKRSWTNASGKESVRWLVDYTDGHGHRRFETFLRKKEADARLAEVKVDLTKGIHVASTKSPTVKEAGEQWINSAELEGLERTTVDQYRQHLNLHIAPFIGRTHLAKVTPAVVTAFKETLRREGRSPAMVRKVITSLGSLIADAHDRGQAAHNAVRDLSRYHLYHPTVCGSRCIAGREEQRAGLAIHLNRHLAAPLVGGKFFLRDSNYSRIIGPFDFVPFLGLIARPCSVRQRR